MDTQMLRRLGSLLLLLTPLVLGACENPVEVEEEHVDVVTIRDMTGQEVLRFGVGVTPSGELRVPAGGEQTFQVVALGEDGQPVALGGEYTIAVTSQPQNGSVSVQPVDRLLVRGGATAGESTFRLDLMHGGHPDLGSDVRLVVQ